MTEYRATVRLVICCGLIVATQAVRAPNVAAQWQVDALIGHVFTSYTATATQPGGSGLQDITYDQRDDLPPFAIGGRLGYARQQHWGVEAALTYDRADVLVTEEDATGTPLPPQRLRGSTFYLSARGLAYTGKAANALRFHFGLGPTLVLRSGEPYEDFSGTRSFGLAVGAGARFRLGRVQLRVDLDDHIYKLGLTTNEGAQFPSKTQNDFLISLGITVYQSRRTR